MKTITKMAIGFAALGLVTMPVLAQDNTANPTPPPGNEQVQPGPGEDGGWWGWWGHGKGGRGQGGCEHEGRGGGRHHGQWGGGQGEGWGGGRGMGPNGEGPGWKQMMGAIDDNNDGIIGDDEAAARVESVFLAMDADGNGELTKEEYMAVRMGPGANQEGKNEARMAERQKAKEDRFVAMDDNKDGKVTKEQFLAAGKARFQAADADKDGKVTPWEFRGMQRQ